MAKFIVDDTGKAATRSFPILQTISQSGGAGCWLLGASHN